MAIIYALFWLVFLVLGIIVKEKEVYTTFFVGAIICLGISQILFKLEKLDK